MHGVKEIVMSDVFATASSYKRYRNAIKINLDIEKIASTLSKDDGFGYSVRQLAAKVGLKQQTTQMYADLLGYTTGKNGKLSKKLHME